MGKRKQADENRAESFNKIFVALNEVFPGILAATDGNLLTFDDLVKIEITSNDIYDGYFDITNDDGCLGAVWGAKDAVNIVIREICNVRKQKVLEKLR